LLKFAEGLASTVNKMLRDEIRKSLFAGLATSLFLRPALRRYKKRFDYTEFGGAPLLGVKGNVVICHGRSDANAIKNAIRWGVRMIDENIAEGIEQQLRGRGLDAPDNDAANGAPA
jgi:glycerol-3-phosphate acyltransferase PlsX